MSEAGIVTTTSRRSAAKGKSALRPQTFKSHPTIRGKPDTPPSPRWANSAFYDGLASGRFVPYIYGLDDPVSRVDPTGLSSRPMCDGYYCGESGTNAPGSSLQEGSTRRQAAITQAFQVAVKDAEAHLMPSFRDEWWRLSDFCYSATPTSVAEVRRLAPACLLSNQRRTAPSFEEQFKALFGEYFSADYHPPTWVERLIAEQLIFTFVGTPLLRGVLGLVGRGATRAASGSVDEVLGALRVGRSSRVRVVDSVDELDDLFSRLSSGGQVIDDAAWGKLIRLPDGTTIGIRSTSRSGGPAIDIIQPGRGRQVVHVDRWNQ